MLPSSMMQSAVITSLTRTPFKPAVSATELALAVAACSRNHPMKAIHNPPKPAPPKKRKIPSAMNSSAIALADGGGHLRGSHCRRATSARGSSAGFARHPVDSRESC